MHKFHLVVAAVILMFASIGCNALRTPGKRFARALDAYNAANAGFIALAESKLITDEQIAASKPYWKIGDAQIAILQTDFVQKRPLNATALKTLENIAFSDVVQQWLTEWLARVTRKE